MRRVGIVTDSTACIPSELIERYGIERIPVFLVFEDRQYEDGLTERAAEFYEKLRGAAKPPTTAAPSPGVYADAMRRAARAAESVLCITVSRQFSAMHEAAIQGAELARREAPDLDIRVLDSDAAAMAQGFVVLEAARAAQDGAGIEDALARAHAVMPNVQLLVALDTLTYLGRSGRVPRLIVWASSPLRVKPVVVFQNGAYRPLAVARTMKGAVERLVRALEQRARPGALHLCVHHTNAPERAQELAERVRADLQPKELYVQEFTQVMGVHTGPGVLGFAFHNEA